MSYIRELDDLPVEVRRGYSKAFRFAAKLDGANVQVATSPAPTFTIHDPAGTQVGSGTATIATLGTPSVSLVSVTIPAIANLGERYSARVTWRVEGSTEDQLYLRQFDVVLWPFDGQVSASELLEDRIDTRDKLDQFGQRLGYAPGEESVNAAAAVFACRGRLKLVSLIRANIAADSSARSEQRASAMGGRSWYGTRAALIINRDQLALVDRHLALEALYNAVAKNPLDGEEEDSKLAQFHRQMATEAWQRVRLDYDTSEDLVPDAEVQGGNGVSFSRRVQA
ncbi:MAG: hypothetical protein IPG45_05945 [Deltaproteobacteria bacterium]|nr:hypothetical protein [Deltaproteobacteria bacterium]